MVKTLLKKQMLELFQAYFVNRKTGKARSKGGTVTFFLLLAGLFICLGFTFYSMAGGLGAQIFGKGLNWLYFALMGLLSMALGVFGSVFNTYASLYIPKDNEFLLSLPIPPRKLLVSRVAGVYVTSFMYSAWVWIPSLIAYWVMNTVDVKSVICPVVMTFVLSLLVSVLSCALGWVVALIAAKAKGKSIITVLLSLTVLVLYYVVYFKIIGSLDTIVSRIGVIGTQIKSDFRFVYLLGMAADGHVPSLLIFTAIVLAVFLVCFLILTKTFMNLVISSENSSRKSGVKGDYSGRTKNKALLFRELKHFTSVSTWMLNGGLGLLIMPVTGIAAIIKHDAIRGIIASLTNEIPEIVYALPVFLTAVVCVIISTDTILPVSVSMEGKSLWIAQSLPVSSWEVIRAKEKMGILLNVIPAVFAAVAIGAVIELRIWEIALVVCTVLVYIPLASDFGLFLNLKSPNFNWTNEATLTKQSMPVMINLFGGWIFCGLLCMGGYWLSGFVPVPAVVALMALIYAVLTVILRRWLKGRGSEILASL